MNRHNLLLAKHAANEYKGWVKFAIWFSMSLTPNGLASSEKVTVK